jgi:hypothetical protein
MILLSSRPEEIRDQVSHIPRINMESNTDRDTIMVRDNVDERLSYLSTDVKDLVTETLSRLAKGSVIWSKMAVEFIHAHHISAIGPMRSLLNGIPLPTELPRLYDELILQNSSNDAKNQELTMTALKLLAVAPRLLSIQELVWAVALTAAEPKVKTVAALSELVDHQKIMNLIQPFISCIDYNELKKRQVRLVHQSVKEYVVLKSSRQQDSATSPGPNQACASSHNEDLEAFALEICMDYLMLDEVGIIPIFTPEQLAIEELPQEYDLFGDREPFEYDVNCTWDTWEADMIHYDPTDRGFGEFFVYASSHWLRHLGAVGSQPLPPLTKIESLCQAGSLRLWNWTNQNCRPGCAIKPRFEFYSELYDPLSITSLYGTDRLLRDMLSNSNVDRDKYLPSPAMGAADQILWLGNLSRLEILFKGKLGHQLRNLAFFEMIIKRWYHARTRHEKWEVAFGLVDSVVDTMVEEQWGHDLLDTAARSGCMPIIRRLLRQAQHRPELRKELLRASQTLGEAVLRNRLDVIECN